VDEELDDARNMVTQKDVKIQLLQSQQATLQASLDVASEETSSLREIVMSRDKRLLAMDDDLQNVRQHVATRDTKIMLMEKELEREREGYRKVESSFVQQQKKMQDEEKKSGAYQVMIEEQNMYISELEKELKMTKSRMESTERTSRGIMLEFEHKIQKMNTELALRDDEIRDLRLVDLRDAEDAVATLTMDLESLTKEMKTNEALATKSIEELETENESLQANTEELIELADLTCKQHEKQVESFEERIRHFESVKRSFEDQVSDQDYRLKERHATITSLTKRQILLEQQEKGIRKERDQLLKSESEAKQMIEKMKLALDLAIIREREDSDMKLQKIGADHRKEVSNIAAKLQSRSDILLESEKTLQERTSLLSEMVDHNKDLESKLEKQQVQISALQEESSRGWHELEVQQRELLKAREELHEKEKSLTTKLHEERTFRDSAEKSLAKMKIRYTEAEKAKKLVVELEKENGALKDKVSRQEAYLERKLKKEKVLRDRITPVANAKQGIQTPIRQRTTQRNSTSASSVCRSVANQSNGSGLSPPMKSVAKSRSSMKQKVEKIPDWELEVE
jgi:chromosome segregation ATPase